MQKFKNLFITWNSLQKLPPPYYKIQNYLLKGTKFLKKHKAVSKDLNKKIVVKHYMAKIKKTVQKFLNFRYKKMFPDVKRQFSLK